MARLIFWDVDTQVDFMHAEGKLYVPGAQELIPNLSRLTQHARARDIRIIASADDHLSQHPEISAEPDFCETFPPHCMRGTSGQRKIPETELAGSLLIEPEPLDAVSLRETIRAHKGDIVFHKHSVDVFSNANVDHVLDELAPEAVVVYGVALDVCNRYVIEGLLTRYPETQIYLVRDATKPIVAEKAASLLDKWMKLGVEVITTDDALKMNGEPREKVAVS